MSAKCRPICCVKNAAFQAINHFDDDTANMRTSYAGVTQFVSYALIQMDTSTRQLSPFSWAHANTTSLIIAGFFSKSGPVTTQLKIEISRK